MGNHLAFSKLCAYITTNSGKIGVQTQTSTEICTGPLARFFMAD